jgi:hypothetical protein
MKDFIPTHSSLNVYNLCICGLGLRGFAVDMSQKTHEEKTQR